MRKLLSILALVLIVALCASFAVSAEKLTGIGSVSKDVNVEFKAAADDTSTIVYSVDVVWDDVTFIYNAGTTKWNPEDHEYNVAGNDASWTDGEGAVIVTNHSNAAVDVTVSFAKASNGTATVNVVNGSFTLESAVGKDVNAADSKTASLTANGTPSSSAKIGTLTVAIAAN